MLHALLSEYHYAPLDSSLEELMMHALYRVCLVVHRTNAWFAGGCSFNRFGMNFSGSTNNGIF